MHLHLNVKLDVYASICILGVMSPKPSETTIRAWARLVKASGIVLSAVEADLKAAGLPPLAWYDALLELDRAGDRRLRPFELQNRMLFAQYNLSRLVDRLAKAGTVERPCEDDGRGQVLMITRDGRALLHKMWPVYAKAIQTHLGEKLTLREASDLDHILGTYLTGIDRARNSFRLFG